MWPFSIFYVLLRKQGKMFKNLKILKESTLLDVIQIKFHDLIYRDFDMLCIPNLPIRA